MGVVTGTLGLFSLVDLFQLLSSARRTGRLVVEHPDAVARIYFDRGQAVHAEFGSLKGVDAIYSLFADERGSFEFRIGLPTPENSISVGTENLVLDAMRRIDEAGRGGDGPQQTTAQPSSSSLSRDAVPAVPVPVPGAKPVELNAEELAVVGQVDGHRSVTRIAMNLGFEPERILVVCNRLVRTGVLKLQNRRARTARLVTRLASVRMPAGTVGVDASILGAWEKALGVEIASVACRRHDGAVQLFTVRAAQGAGPYLELSRDTLFRADLSVNETLLVRPVTDND